MQASMALVLCGLAVLGCADAKMPWNPRPSYKDKPTFARWLAHETNWTMVATDSQMHGGIPYANLMAVSDGTGPQECTGHVYFYYTSMSTMAKDLAANSTVSLGLFEEGMDDRYCVPNKVYDPEDPNCAKMHLVGKVRTVGNGPQMAEKYLFWRHPAMKNWPAGHDWVTATLDLERVDLLDFYGGLTSISAKDYYAADCKASQ